MRLTDPVLRGGKKVVPSFNYTREYPPLRLRNVVSSSGEKTSCKYP